MKTFRAHLGTRGPAAEPIAKYEHAGRGAPTSWRNGKYKHGGKGTPEWKAWWNAKQRCTNPNSPDWKNYGGRGISMCGHWLKSFVAFLSHIGYRPGSGYSLDRIDNNRGYEPGKVRWATRAEQNANKRGRETRTRSQPGCN